MVWDFLVPLTGLEPVRILLRGILSPLCLPIPPQRRCTNVLSNNTIFSLKSQYHSPCFLEKNESVL